ncbi:hypothetical protein MYSI104531_26390 [Mycobacterium simiae]
MAEGRRNGHVPNQRRLDCGVTTDAGRGPETATGSIPSRVCSDRADRRRRRGAVSVAAIRRYLDPEPREFHGCPGQFGKRNRRADPIHQTADSEHAGYRGRRDRLRSIRSRLDFLCLAGVDPADRGDHHRGGGRAGGATGEAIDRCSSRDADHDWSASIAQGRRGRRGGGDGHRIRSGSGHRGLPDQGGRAQRYRLGTSGRNRHWCRGGWGGGCRCTWSVVARHWRFIDHRREGRQGRCHSLRGRCDQQCRGRRRHRRWPRRRRHLWRGRCRGNLGRDPRCKGASG